ncbi:hypothetical protein NUU61_001756 [Penicillium alfredii]|uniref:F-box domain-containing protein n=1 Tax=Penicillium alfredii TaxID=1506179 RepID=A0A9W9FQ98_9EURO|nr:uncharacterized protein NUU61_001756 [Penicillium alfredii]KAJ5104409.1 hypothetical protein NUU61_001756 [Penicillium alfredii]
MKLHHLPSELLLSIAEYLGQSDLNNLVQTNLHLRDLLESHLYRHNVRYVHSSALIFAAISGQENVARKALRENANVKGIDSITPLFEAVSNRHLGMVKLLVESGAPIDRLVDVETFHTGTWPAYLGYGLRGYADTALTKATSLSHLGIMKLLLNHGANVDGTNDFGWTPLPWAAFGCERIFKLLLESGAEINIGGHRQYNPLSQSICGSSRAIFNLLLDRNPDLDRYGGSYFTKGQTPLWTALSQRYYETIGILLDEGANPNLPDIDRGRTVLWMAVVRGHEEVTRALLARGADPNIAPGGQTPLLQRFSWEMSPLQRVY